MSGREKFWPLVVQDGECWRWTGSLNRNGYGAYTVDGHSVAHRWAYSDMIGEIPEGLQLDHLCRNRWCVNPYHLDPVTHRVNSLRGTGAPARNAVKTHCPKGHEYTPENTYANDKGHRVCRACRLDPRAPQAHEHGTNYCYVRLRCRCSLCRAAHAEAARIRYRGRAA